MDLNKLAGKLGLEAYEFREVIRLFIETSAADMTALDSAIAEGDSQKVFFASHSIKGASLNLGLHDISKTARSIEVQARQNILEGTSETAVLLKKKIDRLAGSI